MNFSIIILVIVFILIAIRRIGDIRFELYQIMLFGAIASILTGSISPARALFAIDIDVILFLSGMFIIGSAMEESGLIEMLSARAINRTGNVDKLILFLLFISGISSALLLNDTIIIVSVVLSQILSNVPLVALILPMLLSGNPSAELFCALAAGSTIAGNMLLLGAASNIIIVQNLEGREEEGVSFIEFAKIGIPLTITQTIVYMFFI